MSLRAAVLLLAAAASAGCAAPGRPGSAAPAALPIAAAGVAVVGECGMPEDDPPAPAGPPPPAAPAAAPESTAAGPLALRLVLPAYRLDVLEGGKPVRAFRVAVGTPDHPTPIGDFAVTRVTWNPWWVPPPFDWAKDERVTPPGPANPTGRVKLFFGWYLFLHGTPNEASLGGAASHGCVRMANADAVALARLVHAHASPGVAPALLDSLEADDDRTTTIALATAVPLAIAYDLVEVRGDTLAVHDDVYGRAGRVGEAEALAALARAGIDARRVDRAALRSALGEPPPLRIPLAAILARASVGRAGGAEGR